MQNKKIVICKDYYKCDKINCDHLHSHIQHSGCYGYCIDTTEYVECYNVNNVRKEKLDKLNK